MNGLCNALLGLRNSTQAGVSKVKLISGAADYGDKIELAKIKDMEQDIVKRFDRLIETNRCQ